MKITKTAIFALTLLMSNLASAVMISVTPRDLTLNPGQQLFVDIDVSGLGNNSAPSLSTYDLNLSFDSSIFSPDSVVFGSGLSLPSTIPASLQFVLLVTPEIFNLFELSFNSSSDLDSLQPDNFTLATVVFNTINTGTGSFDLGVNSFGNSPANPLAPIIANSSVTVAEPASEIPAPSTAWLMLFALTGVMLNRQRKTRVS